MQWAYQIESKLIAISLSILAFRFTPKFCIRLMSQQFMGRSLHETNALCENLDLFIINTSLNMHIT